MMDGIVKTIDENQFARSNGQKNQLRMAVREKWWTLKVQKRKCQGIAR